MKNQKMQINWNSKISGVYAWENKINGKMYIGKATNLYKRVYDEMHLFRHGKHQNLKKLFNAIQKYGLDNFCVVKLLECSQDYLCKIEKLLIEYYDTKKNGYNCTFGGEGTLGHSVTKDQIEKQRKSLKQYWTEERKIAHSEKMKKWFKHQPSYIQKNMLTGNEWWLDPHKKKNHLLKCKKSLTEKRLIKQKLSINRRYELQGGHQLRYKKIVVCSPTFEQIEITNIKSFCHKHGLGRVGFYNFLKNDIPNKTFRGWKLISKTY